MNFRQLAYGILSTLPFVPERAYRCAVRTYVSADYYYSVWLRHLVFARNGGMQSFPSVVAELGPGDSLGVGLAALISGVDRYLAFDVVEHAITDRDLAIFDDLVRLFNDRRAIPGVADFPQMRLEPESNAFPAQILGDEQLRAALEPARLQRLRAELADISSANNSISYRAPWTDADQPGKGSIDLIISQAVMEHVVDVPGTYAAMRKWLKDDGFASHQIDFRSHGLFRKWDGHWSCPDWLWFLFLGRRDYLLNRHPMSRHLEWMASSDFEVLNVVRHTMDSSGSAVSKRFADLTELDRITAGCYILSRPGPAAVLLAPKS